jgi:hypothetical protein
MATLLKTVGATVNELCNGAHLMKLSYVAWKRTKTAIIAAKINQGSTKLSKGTTLTGTKKCNERERCHCRKKSLERNNFFPDLNMYQKFILSSF